MASSLQSSSGGGIIAHNTTYFELQNRVEEDPFIAENIVVAEIIEIKPSKADLRLEFLLSPTA